MQKHVNLVDLVKSFPTNIYLQTLASIQQRTSLTTFDHLAEKSESAVRYRTFQLAGHGDFVNALAVSADGAHVVTGGQDGTARVWRAADGVEIVRFEGHAGPVHKVAIKDTIE